MVLAKHLIEILCCITAPENMVVYLVVSNFPQTTTKKKAIINQYTTTPLHDHRRNQNIVNFTIINQYTTLSYQRNDVLF